MCWVCLIIFNMFFVWILLCVMYIFWNVNCAIYYVLNFNIYVTFDLDMTDRSKDRPRKDDQPLWSTTRPANTTVPLTSTTPPPPPLHPVDMLGPMTFPYPTTTTLYINTINNLLKILKQSKITTQCLISHELSLYHYYHRLDTHSSSLSCDCHPLQPSHNFDLLDHPSLLCLTFFFIPLRHPRFWPWYWHLQPRHSVINGQSLVTLPVSLSSPTNTFSRCPHW